MLDELPYDQLWAVDFEFQAEPGEIPVPVCVVARELRTGQLIRLWKDELSCLKQPPYPVDENSLFIAYYASAEIGCHLALGWPIPMRILDLFTEFRTLTNGTQPTSGVGLLGALVHFGLDGISALEKDEMRSLVLSNGPWSDDQVNAILDYCQTDVDALARLLPKMLTTIDLPRSLVRGRYMAACARMENIGVPIDLNTLEKLRSNWSVIQTLLIEQVDSDYGVYDGTRFKSALFSKWLQNANIPWPYKNDKLDLSDEAFREMSKIYPVLCMLHELRTTLSQMRLAELAVGKDGRNRTLMSAFRAQTGRNQPSNKKFIFGPSTWLRGLIKPPPGYGVAYLDWGQQEFGIAAALSGDLKMQEAYLTGDPYLAFAKQAHAAPYDATKESHRAVRERFKACVLAVQYGMGAESLSVKIGQSPIHARHLLQLHKETYADFWAWSDRVVTYGMLCGRLYTTFGWQIRIGNDANDRSLRNFPMQSNGAEMLRLACCMGTERGIAVSAPVHDAVLITSPLDKIDDDIEDMSAVMAEASRIVLAGFELRTDCSVVRYPERYADPRGVAMWAKVMSLLDSIDGHTRLD